jgi:hypothetical protein
LDAAAFYGFAYVDVAFGVDGHGVGVHEFADLVAWAAEAIEDAAAGAVYDTDLFIDFIDDVHVFLIFVRGKFDGGG